MREEANILEVAALGIDWMGFICYEQSPRWLEASGYGRLPEELPLTKIGVFVNASPERVLATARRYRFEGVQLHGSESPAMCRALREQGYRVVKAFAIASAGDLQGTAAYEGCADYFLFDTKCAGHGGSGRQFDWSVLTHYTGSTPFLLSGGIGPGSAEAIRQLAHPRLAGIDLNSGFETAPGIKDVALLHTFINQIQA